MGDGVQLGSAYGVVEIDASGVRQGVQAAEQSLTGLSRQLATIGATLSLGVTVPLVAVGKQALNTAMDFQSSLNMFDAVANATDAQMEQVRQTAVALGKDMTLPATSAADAGEAMTELAKAGLSVEDAMAAAKGALQLAAAGQLNEAQAAAITANALNTFGLAGSEATRIADMLAAGANASSASVQDLAAGFQQGGFAFRAVGLSAEELVTSIAALTNVGLTGSDAGTALKNAMIKLAAPTKDGAALMRQLGINVFDAHGKMLPMPQVIDQMNRGLAGMSQQERLAALTTIVLSDGAKALLPLLDLGSAGFTELQGKVTEQGAAAALAEAQMKGLRGALAGLGSQLETVGMEIATTVLPVLEAFVRKLADLVPKILEVSPNVRNAVLAFLAVAAAAGPVIAAIGAIGAALAFLMSPIGLVVAAVATLAAAFAGDFLGIRTTVQGIIEFLQDLRATVQDAGWQSSEAWEALSSVFGEQGATIIQSIVGVIDYLLELPGRIRGLIGIFGMWRERTDSIAEAMSGFMGTLGMAFPILQPLVPTVQRFIKQFDGMPKVDSFGLAVENVAYALEQMFPALRPVTQALQSFGLWAQGAQIQIENMARSMVETLRGIATGIGPAVSGALERVRGFIEAHSGQIRTVLGAAWEFITGFIRNKVMFVVNLVQAGLALLSGQWEAAWGFLGAALDNKFGWIVNLLTGGSTSISEVFAALWPKVAALGGSAFESLRAAVTSFLDQGLPALRGFAGELIGRFASALATVQGVFATVFGAVRSTIDTLRPAIATVSGVFSNLFGIIAPLAAAIVGSLDDAGAAVGRNLGGAWRAAVATAVSVVTGLGSIINGALGGVRAFVTEHGTEIREFFARTWTRISSIVNLAMQLVQRVVGGGFQTVAGALSGSGGIIQGVLNGLWPVFSKGVDIVLAVIEAFLKLPAPLQNTLFAFAGLAVVAKPALSAVGSISSALSDGLVYARLFGGAFRDLPRAFAVLAQGTKAFEALRAGLVYVKLFGGAFLELSGLSGVFSALGAAIGPAVAAIGAALAPLLPIIFAVAAVAALLFVAWKTNFLGFRDLCTEIGAAIGAVFEFIKTVVSTFWQFLNGQITWGEFTAKVGTAFEGLKTTLAGIWENIKQIAAAAWESIKTAVGGAAQQIAITVTSAWEGLKTAAGNAWETVKTTVAQKVGDILRAVLEWLDNTLYSIENFDLRAAAEHFFGTVLPGIASKIGEALAAVGKWLAGVGTTISSFDLKAAADTFFGTVLPGIATKVSEALTNVGKFLADAAKKISGFDLRGAAVAAFQTVVAGIAAKASEALTNVGKFLTDAAKRIREHTFRSETLTAVQTVIVGILDKVGDILKAVGGFLADISKAISSFDLAQAGKDLVQGFINGISSMASAVWQAAVNIAQQAWNAITGQQGIDAHSPSRKGIQAGEWLGEGIAVGVEQSAPISLGALGAHVKAIVDELARLANSVIEPAAIQSAQAVTDPLAKILENVGKMVDGLDKLASLQTPVSIGAQLQAVSDAVKAVVYHYQWMADHVVAPAAVHSAQAFSDPVAKIFENLSKIVEGTKRLGELAATGLSAGQITAQMTALGQIVESVVKALTDVAGRIPDLGAAAAVLAQNAGPALALIEPAISAFRALMTGGFTMDRADGPFGSLDTYTPVLTRIRGMAAFIQALASELGTLALGLKDVLPAMKSLGENVAPLLAIVTPTLDAYRDLVTRGFSMNSADGPFGSTDTATPMLIRIRGLASFFQALASEIGTLALGLDEVLPAMKTLGESIGPLLAVVTPALDAYRDLVTRGFSMDRADGPFGINDSYTPMLIRIRGLASFFQALASEIGTLAVGLKDVLPAMKSLGENVAPLLAVVDDALAAAKTLLEPLAFPPTANLTAFGTFLETLAREVGLAAGRVADPLETAAKALAENVGPVVSLVKGAFDAMKTLAGELAQPPTVNLTALGLFLQNMAREVGTAAGGVKDDLQKAAKALAENAGPAVNLVKNTVEAMQLLAQDIGSPTPLNITALATFLYSLIDGLEWVTDEIDADLQKAVKAFAENTAPVLALVKTTFDIIKDLPNLAKTLTSWQYSRLPSNWLDQVTATLKGIVTGLAQAKVDVSEADLTAAKGFSEQMSQIVGWVKGGIDAIQGLMNAKRIGPWLADRIVQDFKYLFEAVRKGQGQLTPETLAEAQRFANDATAVAQELVRGLTAFSGAAATTGLRDLAGVLAAVVAALGEAAAALAREMTALRDGAYMAGYGWISQLAAGIRAGMPLLEAALQAVGDLFPHSPAKAGPLRQAPDWQAWMLGGMDRAAGLVASALNQVALPSGAGGYGAGMGAQPLAVNFNGPIAIREEADLVRLAGMIGEMLGGRAVQYQRLNTGWATVS